jgi:hypothetical protein
MPLNARTDHTGGAYRSLINNLNLQKNVILEVEVQGKPEPVPVMTA